MVKRATLTLLLLLLCGSKHLPAQARADLVRESEEIVDRWRSVPPDSAALRALVRKSLRRGGEIVVRGLLETVADTTREEIVRLHALVGLGEFVRPERWIGAVPELAYEAELARAPTWTRCRPSTRWSPGDTLRSCSVAGAYTHSRVLSSHPDYTAVSSIEPSVRDTIRLRLFSLRTRSREPGIAAVFARVSAGLGGDELWDQRPWRECRSAFPDSAYRAEAFDWTAYNRLSRCRNRAGPLLASLWRTFRGDSAALFALVRGSQQIRDRRLQDALQELAQRPAVPVQVRLSALEVLATLAHPRMNTFATRFDGSPPRCIDRGWHARHAVQEEGAAPMGRAGRVEVAGFLGVLARRAERAEVRSAARFLSRCLARVSREHPTPGL